MAKPLLDVSPFKKGVKIKILKAPLTWSPRLHSNFPLNLKFPKTITIKEVQAINSGTYHAMTCGNYGWCVESIITAGYEIVTSNELTNLPDKWYIRGCDSLSEFFKTQSEIVRQGWSGGAQGNGYLLRKGKWDAIDPTSVEDYTEISFDDFIRLSDINRYEETTNQTTNNTTETMQTTAAKQERIMATITSDNRIVVQKDDRVTLNVSLIKETITTRVVKLQSVSYDKKDKAKETPIVTTVEREVSVSVITDENGYIYTGYVVKNPTDKKVSPELGKEIARNRAINPKTNLTPHETITVGLLSKEVLKGIAAQIFTKLSKGSIQLKGVK